MFNRNTGVATTGADVRLLVTNVTSGGLATDTVLNTTVDLALDQSESFSQTLQLTAPGFYLVSVTADPADALYEFMTVKLLEQANPSIRTEGDPTIRMVLDRANEELDDQFKDEPEWPLQ